jgi:transposase
VYRNCVTIFSAMLSLATETNFDIVRQAAILLDRENQRLLTENRRLRDEMRKLKGEPGLPVQQELEALKELLTVQNRALYGDKSEKLPKATQSPLVKEQPQARHGHGPKVQIKLPVVEEIHELDEADKVCPKCGGQLEEMAGQFEESEEITVVERHFEIITHKRKKYRCECNGCVETALGPKKLIPGGRYSLEFAVEVAADKYLDHLPLERQVKRMMREGLDVSRQGLWDQLFALARLLKPTAEKILGEIRGSALVYADETPWRMLGKNRDKKKWYLWAVANESLVYFHADASRGQKVGELLLGEYNGTLMTDGYGVYEALARDGPQIKLFGGGGYRFKHAHCWAHVRRKFFDIKEKYPYECMRILRLIRALYIFEERVTAAGADGLAERRAMRDKRSRKVVMAIRRWAEKEQARFLPESGIVKAIEYMIDLWPGLTLFLDDPQVPLDNNHLERCIRGPVIGRKNHLGSMTDRGADVTALFYTLFETAKLAGVEPKSYVLYAAKAALENPGTVTLPKDLK